MPVASVLAGPSRITRQERLGQGDCLGAKLWPGNVHSADDGEELLLPEIERQQNLGKEVVFRADAAFPRPEISFIQLYICCRLTLLVIWSLTVAQYQGKGPALPGRIHVCSHTIPQQRFLEISSQLCGAPALGPVASHFQSPPQSIPESTELPR